MNEFIDIAKFSSIALSLYLIVVMVIALIRENNGIMDIAYGGGFVGIVWCLALLGPAWTDRQVILMGCITVWGLRLMFRIFMKNWGKPEDFRYRTWREEWLKKGALYFFLRSFGQIYLLQGVIVLIISFPVFLVFSSKAGLAPLEWYNWLGLVIWLTGFFFEVIGDWQLDRFIRNPVNKGSLMTTGLWKYTRHPNYFGEATMWWGIFLVVIGLPGAMLAVMSPLLITFLLTQVSGIPMLEKHWSGRPDWEVYKAKTSAFIPWFPKKETA